jgi:hypothetical protein
LSIQEKWDLSHFQSKSYKSNAYADLLKFNRAALLPGDKPSVTGKTDSVKKFDGYTYNFANRNDDSFPEQDT